MAMSGEKNRFGNLMKQVAEKKTKAELAKRKATADKQMMRRPGESVEAYNKRIKTMTYGNPNE